MFYKSKVRCITCCLRFFFLEIYHEDSLWRNVVYNLLGALNHLVCGKQRKTEFDGVRNRKYAWIKPRETWELELCISGCVCLSVCPSVILSVILLFQVRQKVDTFTLEKFQYNSCLTISMDVQNDIYLQINDESAFLWYSCPASTHCYVVLDVYGACEEILIL